MRQVMPAAKRCRPASQFVTIHRVRSRYIKDGFIEVHDRPGLGIELNPDVVRAHLAPGEAWWG